MIAPPRLAVGVVKLIDRDVLAKIRSHIVPKDGQTDEMRLDEAPMGHEDVRERPREREREPRPIR